MRKVWIRSVGILSAVHVITYFILGGVFLSLLQVIPENQRASLDFFQFYQPFSSIALVTQWVRGLIIAIVCQPLLRSILETKRPWLVFTGVLWGIGFVGSVEPIPGSLEGMLYTITTPAEHLLAMGASLIQTLLTVGLFLNTIKHEDKVNQVSPIQDYGQHSKKKQIFSRMVLIHVATYWAVGVFFYQAFSVYQDAMESMELFQYWRSLENGVMPFVIFFGQFFRGMIIAIFLKPFMPLFLNTPYGWLTMFKTLWGMTFLSAVSTTPWIIQEILVGTAPVRELLVGTPEVTVQMLIFSWWLNIWYNRSNRSTAQLPEPMQES